MIQRLLLEAKSKGTTEEQGRKRSSRVAGDPTWPGARTAGRAWVWNSDQVRARRLPKKALPPYCEQRFRGTAQGPRQAQNHACPKPTRTPPLSRSADALLQAGLGTPHLADFQSCSSSTGVHCPVRGSSPSSVPGRALGGGNCARSRTVRSQAGGGPGRRATLVPPREHRERGAWPGWPRGSAPSPRRLGVEQKSLRLEGSDPLESVAAQCFTCPSVVGLSPRGTAFRHRPLEGQTG